MLLPPKGGGQKSRVGESGSIYGTGGGEVGVSGFLQWLCMSLWPTMEMTTGCYARLAQLGKWSYFEGPFLRLLLAFPAVIHASLLSFIPGRHC